MNSHRWLATASLLAASAVVAAHAAPPGGPLGGACKQDVETLCKDVQPGGGRIAACLKENLDQVSDGCKAAMKAHRRQKTPGDGAT